MAWDFQQCGVRDQQRLRLACAYAQTDQSLCTSLEYSMTVKLLTAHHLECQTLKGAAQARLSLHLSKSTLLIISCRGSYYSLKNFSKELILKKISRRQKLKQRRKENIPKVRYTAVPILHLWFADMSLSEHL